MSLVEKAGSVDFLKTLKILYVEDDMDVRALQTLFLQRRFACVDTACNGEEGLMAFRNGSYDVVVTDLKMPVLDGLEMAVQIKAQSPDIPVIVVTAFNESDYFVRSIEIGIDRYVIKPVVPEALIDAIEKTARARVHQLELEQERHNVVKTLQQIIEALGRAIEKRDPYTFGHQKRVSLLAVGIGKEMGLNAEALAGLRLGALIHDVGKINIPAEVMTSPRRFLPVELELMQTHPSSGFEIVRDIHFPWPIAEIIYQHHERMDGSGYPQGLRGGEIAFEARIMAVADVVEAIASHRPYRPSLGLEAARAEILEKRGTAFDADVVDACVRVIDKTQMAFWDEKR